MNQVYYLNPIPTSWMAFIPADEDNPSTWLNFLEIREVSVILPDEGFHYYVRWSNGETSVFLGDRAAAFDSEFAKFRAYLESQKNSAQLPPT